MQTLPLDITQETVETAVLQSPSPFCWTFGQSGARRATW